MATQDRPGGFDPRIKQLDEAVKTLPLEKQMEYRVQANELDRLDYTHAHFEELKILYKNLLLQQFVQAKTFKELIKMGV